MVKVINNKIFVTIIIMTLIGLLVVIIKQATVNVNDDSNA